jgi:hypothetical protein
MAFVLAGLNVSVSAGGALSPADASEPWHTLGIDVRGDWAAGYVDIVATRVRPGAKNLLLRFVFADLPVVPPAGAKVGAHLSTDGGRTKCCYIRGDLGPTDMHEISYRPRGCHARGCWQELAVRGLYDAEKDRLTVFLPRRELRIGTGDVISGCPPPDGEGVCDSYANAVYTSPTLGMYGYDGITITDPYEVP